MKKKKTPPTKTSRPSFHERLKGFDIKVNEFGEMESNFEIDKLNQFLNEEVEDKKIGKKKNEEEE